MAQRGGNNEILVALSAATLLLSLVSVGMLIAFEMRYQSAMDRLDKAAAESRKRVEEYTKRPNASEQYRDAVKKAKSQ